MVLSLANNWMPRIISQFWSSSVYTSVSKDTPCIDHWKFLHTEEQVMSPPSATWTVKAFMLVSLQCNLAATWLLMKLWVLPESTKINKGCLSTLPVTFKDGGMGSRPWENGLEVLLEVPGKVLL
uniref:Uncharacterized protein n=1 Tax=Populus alba TaxID=43335 RepID=A0A4U5Q779_POPAL|nr:hypothetical protein D5086_0000146400 [Populus alba]